MWDADALETVVGLAFAQLFGGKSAPPNFSRFPEWCAKCCSALFPVLFWQCVGDLISIERCSTVGSARDAWLAFAGLSGWDIPLAKSPPPCRMFQALGVFVDLRPLPMASALIQVCEKRIEAILMMLASIVEQARLPSGLASSLVGCLMFACVAFAGFIVRKPCKYEPADPCVVGLAVPAAS